MKNLQLLAERNDEPFKLAFEADLKTNRIIGIRLTVVFTQISKFLLTFHAYLKGNLNCYQQVQPVQAYSYPAEVLEGISNFLALEVAYK